MAELEERPYITREDIDLTGMPHERMKRCLLLDDGTVNYYLDPNDSTLKEDGSPAVLDGSDGQVMVEIPKFWYRKLAGTVGGEKSYRFEISDEPTEGFDLHPAFYRDRNGDGIAEEVDFRYMSAFMGVGSGETVTTSLPNKLPAGNIAIGTARTYCENRGTGWGLVDYNLIYAIQILYITEFGHPDSQTVIGRGYVDGNSSATQTGSTLQYGNNTFGETAGKYQMSYRGIEDLWGNTYYWLDGLKSDGYDIMIGNVGFNDNGTGYERIVTGITSNVIGNISDVHDDSDAGFIIKATNSNSNYGDKLYDYGLLFSSHFSRFGASWSAGSSGGLFRLQLADSASNSVGTLSLRLSF
jgi:hypothetical protein